MNKWIVRGIVLAALVAASTLGWITLKRHQRIPTTDYAMVSSDVVRIAAQVSGPVVKMDVNAYDLVIEGQILCEIDPEPFEIAVENAKALVAKVAQTLQVSADDVLSAEAELKQTLESQELAQRQYERRRQAARTGAISQSELDDARTLQRNAKSEVDNARANLSRAQHALGAAGDDNPDMRLAIARLNLANLDLSHAKVKAPRDGYITNLRVYKGSYLNEGDGTMTLIADDTWRVFAFMRENQLERIKAGQPADIFLPAYPGKRFKGRVVEIGLGIDPGNMSVFSTEMGLTTVDPTLDWVRLAQRFPVKINVVELPEGVQLRVGLTATVRIDTTAAVSPVEPRSDG